MNGAICGPVINLHRLCQSKALSLTPTSEQRRKEEAGFWTTYRRATQTVLESTHKAPPSQPLPCVIEKALDIASTWEPREPGESLKSMWTFGSTQRVI
jgi:hypothetical protein